MINEKYDSHEAVAGLVDKALNIIAESLEVGNQYDRLNTAIQFTQFIALGSFNERIKKLETWASVVQSKEEKKDKS